MMSASETRLTEELRRAHLEIKLLRQKLDALARRMFGRSSEKADPDQLQLLLEGLEEIAQAQTDALKDRGAGASPEVRKAAAERAPRGPRLAEHLPVKEIILDPAEVQACPDAWVRIGEEVSEQLDYTPASFVRLRLVRPKYVSREQRHLPPVIAPLPPGLQERCLAAPSLLAHCMVSRYRDHLPWHRLEQIYAGLGAPLSRQTLCNWSGMAADAVQLVVKEIGQSVFAGGCVQIDETPIEYLSPGHGKTKNGYLWVAHSPAAKATVFHWRTGRAAQCLHEIVPESFRGVIQCDGYSAYNAFAQSPPRKGSLRLAGCWAHARRGFFEAREYSPDAVWVLSRIQQLYAVEEGLREARAGPQERHAARQAQSRPLVEEIHAQLLHWNQKHTHLPQSLTGRAIRYALGQWSTLTVFLEDGRVEIDNNLVENAIRPSAIGKKNWLFVGDAKAGDRAAAFYTLIGNCRQHGADPYAYLLDLFTRLPSMTNRQINEMTPAAWAARTKQAASPAHPEARQDAAQRCFV
jgi:transposase